MGMQCTFSYSDLSHTTPTYLEGDAESDIWTVTCLREDTLSGQFWQFNLSVPEDKQTDKHFCWFDCGRLDATRIAMFRFLIENRIPFTCA